MTYDDFVTMRHTKEGKRQGHFSKSTKRRRHKRSNDSANYRVMHEVLEQVAQQLGQRNRSYIMDNSLCCEVVPGAENNSGTVPWRVYRKTQPFFDTPCDSRLVRTYFTDVRDTSVEDISATTQDTGNYGQNWQRLRCVFHGYIAWTLNWACSILYTPYNWPTFDNVMHVNVHFDRWGGSS